ncbi:MAG: hypothetical protein R2695_15160 [Acidimicrobiales bacterium]
MDLPGNGYAKVAKTEQAKWATMLTRYVEQRDNPWPGSCSHDGEIGPTPLTSGTADWPQHWPADPLRRDDDKVRPAKRRSVATSSPPSWGSSDADIAV